ncbi:DUF4340 domain-containing protein [Roseibacillus ishigakijimensis]|uniref:DUF4340 domain-containing protein n=1 Tax=Roseibacillus ishigakijimensis TaxID=454146 RepID=A0A934VMS6_9BACT|nr:DUF4340 domain-containing protein [Roseibacillus ishigakijimensis]MBK1834587.1 DUF4340 domain-containing protein [Roseibacillus ishigakijimensis]
MSSKVLTVFLAVLALASGAMAFLHFTQKNLASLFGEPALPTESLLFALNPSEIRQITITTPQGSHDYEERQGQWLLKNGSTLDRADYRVLETLLAFSADLTVLESLPAKNNDLKAMGLDPALATITLTNGDGEEVASYHLGERAPWQSLRPAKDQFSQPYNQSSLYLRPRGSDHLYLCTSPYLDEVVANGFRRQRDLRPFFFPPELLAEVTITRPNGKLVLARESPVDGWQIEKPFKLDADPTAAAELVAGLYNLTARKALNKPAPPLDETALELALRFFSLDGTIHETPVTLSLAEPEPDEHSYYIGRLDDWRSAIEFEIPRAATDEHPGVDALPLTLERLRGARLSGLDLRYLKKLTIRTPELATPLEIEVAKSPISGEMRVQRTLAGRTEPANELTFYNVKKTLLADEGVSAVADAVEDFSSYGLDQPILVLAMELFDGTRETLFFGEVIDEEGIPHYYFRRNEARSVLELQSNAFYNLATRPYQWRDALVWNFNMIDLKTLRLETSGSPALTLKYSDLAQTWEARIENEDVTALLNENRANRYLETLESLSAVRWLGPDHRPAQLALESPVYTLTALFDKPDDEEIIIESKQLSLAGAASQSGSSPFYYGKIENDPNYFILDLATVRKLAQPLLEQE